MKRTLKNIVDKKHDKDVCKTNCIENGKFFNHEPHHCPYFTGSLRFSNFLEKKVIDDVDSPEATTNCFPNVAEYWLQMIQLDNVMHEVNLGVRNQDDLLAQQKKTEEL